MKLVIRTLKVLGITLALILVIIGFILYPLLRGATGYTAKMLCSGVFVEGLSQQQVEQMELGSFPFNRVESTVDFQNKQVKSTIFKLVSQSAQYEEGIGATLYPNGYNEIIGRIPLPVNTRDTIPWPTGSVIADTVAEGIDVTGLNQYISQHFMVTSRAVVVIKDGQLIAEHYAEGIDKYTPLLGWSMTKSIAATLVGILVKDGVLTVNQPVTINDWPTDERQYITLNNLLQMSSGLKWNEDYSKTSLTDVSRMLYLESDMSAYASSVKSEVSPDSVWRYSSGTTNIISGMLRWCFDEYQDYYQFPRKRLFNKLGMQHSLIETDAVGNFVGSSYGYCSARDWARLGMLYLNNGVWQGEQILPEWWVQYATTPARQSNGQYGAQIWLNASQQHMPDLPADVYFFNGYRGQRVTVMPSMNMVVVCLNSSAERIDFNSYLKGMLKYVQ
ncbi:serine hydrolase [Carboxylicivirga sediminis]|uniref:Serine hydrolase n=1 Tax=Carboxylicivirga sediminis TaxID=2006564 RepID=A0A941J0Q5_9BACT|nr:serine hydrolase [Carboxylicivirga sediminis]MBR8538243.1 serine hydrolase [Carboxylicivirga sediminis]